MTPTEQDKELREAIHEIMIAFRHEYGNGYIDRCIKHLDSVMQLITAHTNAEIAKTLDRLKSKSINAQTYQQADGTQYGSVHSFQAVPLSAIQAERTKLQEMK